jgi:hypothetical protein
MFIDTNIVRHAQKGIPPVPITGTSISSVTASELLMVYGTSRIAANYYVPNVSVFHLMTGSVASKKRDHPIAKRFTDQIVFNFGQDFEPIIEFASNAMTRMINQGSIDVLRQSIAFLGRGERKSIRDDFEFLVDNRIKCVALTPGCVNRAYELLGGFMRSGGNLKRKFRNSWNDMLILSTAREKEDELVTADCELARFAGASFGNCSEEGTGFVRLRAGSPKKLSHPGRSESKGYINDGWMATFRKGPVTAR